MLDPLLIAVSALLGLACLHAAVRAWRRRRSTPEAAAMSLVLASDALWIAAYAGELVSTELSSKLFWDAIQTLPAIGVPVATVGLVWRQRGGDREFSVNWLTGGLVAGTALALVELADQHQLVTRLGPHLDPSAGWPALDYRRSLGEMVVHSGAVGCVLASVAVLAHGAIVELGSTRRRMLALTGCLGLAAAAAVLELVGVRVLGRTDLTPIGFAVAQLAAASALLRRQLVDLGQLAGGVIIAELPDPVLVLERSGRIAERNPAAERLLGRAAAVGQELASALPELAAMSRESGTFELERGARVFEGRWVPVTTRSGERRGSVVLLRDVTLLRLPHPRRSSAEPELQRPLRAAEDEANVARRLAYLERAAATLFVDRDGRLIDANGAARELLRLDADALPGTPLAAALAEGEDRASRTRAARLADEPAESVSSAQEGELTARVQRALKRASAGERVRLEVAITRGAARHALELTVIPLDAGTPSAGVLLVEARDVAERREAQAQRAFAR